MATGDEAVMSGLVTWLATAMATVCCSCSRASFLEERLGGRITGWWARPMPE